jgi:two-component system chemotaxis sensor kinase CheA
VADLTQLRQQIEDLALRSVLAGGGDAAAPDTWLEALETIRALAQQDGASSVAEAAGSLLQSAGGFDTERSVQNGIALLQRALDDLEQAHAGRRDSLAADPELLSDFILESREHLSSLETQLLTLDRDPADAEALHSVFRSFHTVKGLAGFLELWDIQTVAHEVETVLDRARNSQFTITPAAIDVILASADYLRVWLEHLELRLNNKPSRAPGADAGLLGRIASLEAAGPEVPAAGLASLAEAVHREPEGNGRSASPASETKVRAETAAVRVDTAKLDYLVDMAGEMVIAETLVRHDPELARFKSSRLQRNMAQLTRITSELQKTAMAMRLVPVGPLFRKMARLVRDLSRQFGKRVEMQTEGDEVELDRTIVEELADPLMHMVRNSLDHGVEMPAARQAAGKLPVATVLLKAHHQAGHVVIEISDDGQGLDREKIRAKACDRGLTQPEDTLTDNEICNLIFEPGFSTADRVTNVSGRGVGMDVVRRSIEKLRGRVEVRSVAGQGASFVLKLPLTLAIIDGLVVGVGTERYIVPLFSVREMFRPREDTVWTVQQRGEMALVRGALLPVIRLYRKFGVAPQSEDPSKSVLIVAESETRRFCLLVDELIGKQEVVIKSLGETFKETAGIAGGAILGDGRVGLILDLDRLFRDKANDTTH